VRIRRRNEFEWMLRLRRFVALMNANNEPIGMEIAELFDFTPHRCVLDVAGAFGGMVISIAKRYQHLRAIVMDLPPVCNLAAENIAAKGRRQLSILS